MSVTDRFGKVAWGFLILLGTVLLVAEVRGTPLVPASATAYVIMIVVVVSATMITIVYGGLGGPHKPIIHYVTGPMGNFHWCSRCKSMSNSHPKEIVHQKSCPHSQKR